MLAKDGSSAFAAMAKAAPRAVPGEVPLLARQALRRSDCHSETALTDSQVASEALSEAILFPAHCNRYAHLFPGDQVEYVMTPPTQVTASPDEELTQIHSESQVQEERPNLIASPRKSDSSGMTGVEWIEVSSSVYVLTLV